MVFSLIYVLISFHSVLQAYYTMNAHIVPFLIFEIPSCTDNFLFIRDRGVSPRDAIAIL